MRSAGGQLRAELERHRGSDRGRLPDEVAGVRGEAIELVRAQSLADAAPRGVRRAAGSVSKRDAEQASLSRSVIIEDWTYQNALAIAFFASARMRQTAVRGFRESIEVLLIRIAREPGDALASIGRREGLEEDDLRASRH